MNTYFRNLKICIKANLGLVIPCLWDNHCNVGGFSFHFIFQTSSPLGNPSTWEPVKRQLQTGFVQESISWLSCRLAEGWGRRGVGATRAAVPPQVTWQGWVLWPTSSCNTDPSSHFTLLPSSSFSSTLKLFTYPCHLFYHLRWGLTSIR